MPTWMKPLPSQEYLLQRFSYDPASGVLRWKIPSRFSRRKARDEAGCVGTEGYKMVTLDLVAYRVHRIIWKMVYGNEPEEIDHENGDTGCNKLINLREATRNTNMHNKRKSKNPKSCTLKGVSTQKAHANYKNPYKAQIKFNNEWYYIGLFSTEMEAHLAYVKKAKELFGVYANDGAKPC